MQKKIISIVALVMLAAVHMHAVPVWKKITISKKTQRNVKDTIKIAWHMLKVLNGARIFYHGCECGREAAYGWYQRLILKDKTRFCNVQLNLQAIAEMRMEVTLNALTALFGGFWLIKAGCKDLKNDIRALKKRKRARLKKILLPEDAVLQWSGAFL